MLNIQIEAPDINDIKRRLGKFSNRAHVVIYRSVNRTLSHTKTNIGKKAPLRYLIKKKTVLDSISVRKATAKNPFGTVTSKGTPIPLTKFDVSHRKAVKRRKRKWRGSFYSPDIYKVKVLKNGEQKGVKRMFYVKGHLLQRPEGATREENLKVKNWLRTTLSVPKMINSPDVVKEIKQQSMKKLKERIDHEIKYEMERLEG